MFSSVRASSAPSSPRPEQTMDTRVAELPMPTESRKMQLPPVTNHTVPDELLVSLTSTFCSRSTEGHSAHHRHCKDWGVRRPDAVWHHPLGRKKYKYFLENPTVLNGAGRDISFLCDAMTAQKKTTLLPPLTDRSSLGDTQDLSASESVIPEEYHMVQNKGLKSLELYEDAFTVQLQDEEQKPRVFPSLRPSGRLEVVQLMRMMDDMLLKAGVDQRAEELTGISQMESLLDLVRAEQNIYNIVFHEVIRQVTVGCAERGQLLAKLRQRYQSMFERIPRCLKALHTEAVAQGALNRRLAVEIHRIQTSVQQLSVELSAIREHDAFASQQADHAHRRLAVALEQTRTNSDVVQGYHELYELQRSRLEAQLLQMTEQRDNWKQLTLCLALKMIGMKKLQLFTQLHLSEQSWQRTAEHCSIYLSSKDTEYLNTITAFTDQWKEQLTTFMSQLKETERAQCEQLNAVHQGVTKWLNFFSTQNNVPDPKYDTALVKEIHGDLQEWSNTLALQCENYRGEKLLCCQQKLGQLGQLQKGWLNTSLQLFGRHPPPSGETPEGQQAVEELDGLLSEFLKRLDTQVTGETGIHGQMISLLESMESWMSELGAAVGQPDTMSISDWLKLEHELHRWQCLVEKASQTIFCTQTEKQHDKNKPDTYAETENMLEKVQKFISSLSNFADGENQRLCDEIAAIHMAQTRWMVDLLLLVVPDHNEDQNQEQECHTSRQTLDEDAKILAEKLDCVSKVISSSCKLILEEQNLPYLPEVEAENEMNECRKLQALCTDWVETCMILLSGLRDSPVREAEASTSSDAPVETLVNNEISGRPTADDRFEGEIDTEPQECTSKAYETQPEGELTTNSTVVKLIGYDGNITQKKLGESTVRLNGTGELVVSPATDEAQKAFSDLTTVGLLQQELHNSELQVQSAEQRALRAEEALQAALDTIQDLERQLQSQSRAEPQSVEEQKKTPPASPTPVTPSAPPKKNTAEAQPKSSTKRTKKR